VKQGVSWMSFDNNDARRHPGMPAAGALVVGAALLAATSAEANADRLVIATDPPSAESNLFWERIADRYPGMQGLVGIDPVTGTYDDSGLARSWDVSEDATEWTFHLHQDAEFHFGWGPVTAHDVVHSYHLHTGDDSRLTNLAQLRAKEVEAIDDHTVVFRFDGARTDYAYLHAARGSVEIYSLAQHEAEGLDGYHRQPAGTGPYRFVERRAGEGILFERVEDHWQGIEPDFAEIEFRWTPEAATKLAMLLAGEAHIIDLPRELYAEAIDAGFEVIPSTRVAMQTGVVFGGLYQTSGDPAYRDDLPWVDIRIREAMNRALNREEMLDVLYDGNATVVERWGMVEGQEGYAPELVERFEADYGYDPERAKELLAEAGYPDAFDDPEIPLLVTTLSGNPEFPLIAELLQVYLEEVGFQTRMVEMDWPGRGATGRAREAYLVHPTRNMPIRPTEELFVNFFTVEGTPYGGYESDTIQELTYELVATIDPVERDRIARRAFTYLFDQYADIPLGATTKDYIVNPDVVAGWTFPGATSTGQSHWHLIEAAD
jgi:peptide/nickel transport system substrate-binding protein